MRNTRTHWHSQPVRQTSEGGEEEETKASVSQQSSLLSAIHFWWLIYQTVAQFTARRRTLNCIVSSILQSLFPQKFVIHTRTYTHTVALFTVVPVVVVVVKKTTRGEKCSRK